MARGRTFIIIAVLVLLFIFGMLGAGGFVLFTLFHERAPEVEEGSVLMCDLRRALSEVSEESLRSLLWGRKPVNLTEAVRVLHAAAGDERIERVVVRLGGLSGIGWGAASEIRTALLANRESGKRVEAYIEAASDLSYYVATAASQVFLSPSGMLLVDGIYGEVQFLKNLFGKADIRWQAVKAGDFKSYPETFTRESISGPFREQVDALLSSRFAAYTEAIALGRTLSPEAVARAVNEGPYLIPAEAVAAGLVDTLLFWSDYRRSIGLDESGDTPSLTLEEYRDAGAGSGGKSSHNIAVVFVVGDILPGKSHDGFCSKTAGSETIVEALDKAAEDEEIEAIVIRVSSPGGSVMASDDIWNGIERAKASKPIIVSMGDVAASGGYWISAGADVILADPTTVTGSIGVFALRPVWNRFYDKIGLGVQEFKRGENAAIFRSSKPWTKEHLRLLEAGIDHTYREFLKRVSEGRGIPVEEVEELAGGRVWGGTSALQRGLVDRIGGIAEAIEIAKSRSGIPAGDEVRLRFYPEEKPILEKIREGEFSIRSAVRSEVEAVLERYGLAGTDFLPYRLEDGSIWARLPFRIPE